MEDDSKVPVLVRTLNRLKACANGQQKKVCLTSKECEKVCGYIWWLQTCTPTPRRRRRRMKSDEATVTLYACHTAEGLAQACRDHANVWSMRCPVGWYFACPLAHLGDGRCAKIEAKDWEAVMVEADDANAD